MARNAARARPRSHSDHTNNASINHDERDAGVPTSRVLDRRELGGRDSTIQHDQSHRPPLRVVRRIAECSRQCARADRIVTRLIELGAQ